MHKETSWCQFDSGSAVFALAPALVLRRPSWCSRDPAGPRLVFCVSAARVGGFYALAFLRSLSVSVFLMSGVRSSISSPLMGAFAPDRAAHRLRAARGARVWSGVLHPGPSLMNPPSQSCSPSSLIDRLVRGGSAIVRPFILTLRRLRPSYIAGAGRLPQPPFDMAGVRVESGAVAVLHGEYTGFPLPTSSSSFSRFSFTESSLPFGPFASLAATLFLGRWSVRGCTASAADWPRPARPFSPR